MIRLLTLIFSSIYNVNCQTLSESSYFVNTAEMSGANYRLDWNYSNTDITFRVTARTAGWVGFGISPNGGMKNSDLMLAWTANNGSNQFRDAHTENENSVLYDTVQNWQPLFYSQRNGATTVIFRRSIKVCNPSQPANEINIDIAPTQYVIFAWGTNYQGGLPAYHGSVSRGTKFLPLLSSLNAKITLDMSRIETSEDFRVSTTIKEQQTEYFCSMHRLPDDYARSKRHLVRVNKEFGLFFKRHFVCGNQTFDKKSFYFETFSVETLYFKDLHKPTFYTKKLGFWIWVWISTQTLYPQKKNQAHTQTV